MYKAVPFFFCIFAPILVEYAGVMKYSLFIFFFLVVFSSCGTEAEIQPVEQPEVKYRKFNGNYNKTFNDLNDLQLVAALENGITPMKTKDDTAFYRDLLVRIPAELPYYKMDRLTHSVPYLVPKASELLMKISVNFYDSLRRRNIPPHKLVFTSLTRTEEDVKKLSKNNINASLNSTHFYGTTFDISWKRFEKQNPFCEDVNSEKLKLVLGEVLYDLQQRNMCYIKHERKQACFHVTVR